MLLRARVACAVLVPRPGIQPTSRGLNHWTTRDAPGSSAFNPHWLVVDRQNFKPLFWLLGATWGPCLATEGFVKKVSEYLVASQADRSGS